MKVVLVPYEQIMAILGVRVELSLREELGMGMRMGLEVVLVL